MGQGTGSKEQEVAGDIEPWLRGTHTDLDPVKRQIIHALELAQEDAIRWCAPLTGEQINARPFALPSVAFHLRHIARSLDRLLSYAEGTQLDATQFAALHSELDPGATTQAVMAEFSAALREADRRIRAFSPETYSADRGVGRAALPSTVGGLLVHCAEHTQRHIGQAITTAKIARAVTPPGAPGQAASSPDLGLLIPSE